MQTAPVTSLQAILPPRRSSVFRAVRLRRPTFGRRRIAKPAAEMAADQGEWIISYRDIRQFLMAYTTCFVVVMGMII